MSTTTVDEFLAHHGVKGMRWGVRESKKKTGISRHRGAILDRNAIVRNNIELARQGDKFRISAAIGRAFVGEARQKKNWQTSIDNLKAQDRRLRSKKKGALTFLDRVDLMTVPVADLLITVRPVK